MKDPQQAAEKIAQTFEHILQVQMQGIPLLNKMLRVETLGFQVYLGRVVGIVITPWLMNLVMLPGEDDHWDEMELGDKQPHQFPSRTYKFMVNEVEGIGKCQTYSLYSPMWEFVNQDHALAAAQSFLDTLMVERELTEEERVDEELLGRIMRGEEVPEVELDGFAASESIDDMASGEIPEPGQQVKCQLSRRDLLRGAILGDA